MLLIANENELIRCSHREIIEGGKKRITNEYTESSLQYLKFKEKTVSDTIQFYGDTKSAITSIINQYNCKQFSWLAKGEKLNDLEKLLYVGKIDNLRTFIYACQKTAEIYEQIDEFNLKDNYLECIFYGIILFSRSIKCGIFPEWDGTEYLSSKLTGTGIPLFRFCYDYIRWHMFDKSNIEPTIKAYKDYRMMNQRIDDDITVIINYALSSEADVIAALKNIDKRLSTPFDVPFGMYINLAYYLVKFHFLLNYDFSSIREKMLNNLKNNAQNISSAGLMFAHFEFESNEEEEMFGVFKRDIEESIKSSQHYIEKFSYDPSRIDEIQKKADSLTQYSHRFISLYNLEKLVDMLFLCNAKQLFSLRAAIRSVYKNASLGQFERDDYKFMEEMLSLISQKKKKSPKNFDRIQLMHIDYLCNDLKEFILQSFQSEKL